MKYQIKAKARLVQRQMNTIIDPMDKGRKMPGSLNRHKTTSIKEARKKK